MSALMMVDASPQSALEDAQMERDQFVDMATIAMARAEKAEAQREELRALLVRALASMATCRDDREGHDDHDLGCANCEAGVPMKHSLGCNIESALRRVPS